MSTLRRAAVAALVVTMLAFCSGSSREARADTSTAVYDDLKDVIAKLVERRVANGAADFIERASTALRFYLRRTIDRVRHDQWSALRDALVDDLSDIVGDYAFWALMDKSGKPSFAKFAACFEPIEIGAPHGLEDPLCASLRVRAATKGDTLYHDNCEAIDAEKRDGIDLACDVAAMMRATLLGHVEEGSRRLMNITIDAAAFLSPSFERTDAWESSDLHGHHSALTRVLGRYADGKLPEWLTNNRSPTALKDLLADCLGQADTKTGQSGFPTSSLDLLNDAKSSAVDKRMALLCLNAWVPLSTSEFSAELDGKPALVGGARTFPLPPLPAGKALDEQAIGDFFHGVYAAVAGGAPNKRVTVRFGRMGWSSIGGLTWQPEPGSPSLKDAVPVLTALVLNQAEGALLTKTVEDDLAAQSALARFKCQENCPFEILRLGAQLRAFSERKKTTKNLSDLEADSDAALRILRSHSAELAQIQTIYEQSASKKSQVVLRVVRTIQSVDTRNEPLSGVPALVRAMIAGERAEFATAALRVALKDVIDGPDEETPPSKVDRLYGAFVVNFVNYLLADKTGTPQESVRDGFRVSAARLLDGLSSSDGYYRSGFSPLPVVSLRFSWNPGYFSATSGDGFRYIASVDWPVVRTRFGPYAAVQFSMFDLAAPLAEFALRNPVQYSNQGLVLIDTIRPRLSLLFGIPQITRNVTATIGVSARLLAVCGTAKTSCDAPRDPGPGNELTYRTTLTNNAANNQIPEVNLGVSYVF